jgi:hypothetical protein
VVTVIGVGDAQHVYRVFSKVTVPSMPLKVSGGQLRVLQVGARSALDVWSSETDAASHAERIPAMAENGTTDVQREVFYDIVAVDSVDASGRHWPRFG